MSEEVGLFLTLLLEIAVFGFANYYAFKYSQKDIKKRIWAGIIFLLLTPMILFGTLFFAMIYDSSGWGAGILAVVATALYFLNGLIVLLSSMYLYFKKS
ncbi:hypothetical protein [Mesobacillus zeae]|uniref:hypothetical protein n=1 Tax=Mesobacillus zeae TaxID=1917180 RepID=UPI00115C5890